MTMNQAPARKEGTTAKVSALGKASRIVLVVGIFLVIFIPLFYIYQQQPARQAALSQEQSSSQKIIGAAQTKRSTLEAEIKQEEQDLKVAKASFYRLDSAPDILDKLLALAKTHGIEVISTRVTVAKKTFVQGKKKTDFPLLSLQIGVRGQVSKFQNFLLGLDAVLPVYELKEVNLDIAQTEKEQDKGSITISVYCLDEGK